MEQTAARFSAWWSMVPIRQILALCAVLMLLAGGPATASAQEGGGGLLVSVNGMALPLRGPDDRIAGTLILDFRIEARDAAAAGRIEQLVPRIRDTLLSRLVLQPAQGIQLGAGEMETIRRRILRLVGEAVGAGAVSNIYFVQLYTVPV